MSDHTFLPATRSTLERLLTFFAPSQNPLPPPEIAPGVPAPDSTRDPMLRNAEQGAALLEVRKGLAFQVSRPSLLGLT